LESDRYNSDECRMPVLEYNIIEMKTDKYPVGVEVKVKFEDTHFPLNQVYTPLRNKIACQQFELMLNFFFNFERKTYFDKSQYVNNFYYPLSNARNIHLHLFIKQRMKSNYFPAYYFVGNIALVKREIVTSVKV